MGGVSFTGVTTLQQPGGGAFATNTVDPEGLRLDAVRGKLYWSNEGQRSPALQNPTVRAMNLDGTHAGEFAVPAYYYPSGSSLGLSAGDQGAVRGVQPSIQPTGQRGAVGGLETVANLRVHRRILAEPEGGAFGEARAGAEPVVQHLLLDGRRLSHAACLSEPAIARPDWPPARPCVHPSAARRQRRPGGRRSPTPPRAAPARATR